MLTTAARTRDERGAVTILVALMMVSLCVAAAMVLDLGLVRVDRQQAKSAQDAAAMAGANSLAPNPNDPTFHPFLGVCQALQYLKVNDPEYATFKPSSVGWFDGTGLGKSEDGCTAAMAALVCTPNSPGTFARFVGTTADGRSTVYIQSGYKNPDGNPTTPIATATAGNITTLTGGEFSEDSLPAYAGDEGAAAYGGCDQVAVIITEARSTSLGAPAAPTMGTRTRSVARVRIDPPKSPFALLLLERADCQVISNGSNGVAAIKVMGYKDHPGLIHVDSNGSGAGCNKALMVGQKVDGVVAQKAPLGGAPAQITTTATTNKIDSTDNVYAEPKTAGAQPLTTGLVTRSIVDQVYLKGVRDRVAESGFAWSAGTAWGTANSGTVTDPAGGSWTVINSCPSGAVAGVRLLIKCANMNNSATFTDATDLIFTGQLGGASTSVRMPKAANVYVRGKVGSNQTGASAGTELSMHDAGVACGASVDGKRARLFIRAGQLNLNGGFFRACQTSVILLGGYDDGCIPASNGTYVLDGKVCNSATDSGNGILSMGGTAAVEWTAPSLIDDETPSADVPQLAHDQLEDLALWAESSGTHSLGGGGSVHLSGVFVAPNAKPLKLNGNPTWDVLNSQYVVRTLENDGGAVFTMRPMPSLPIAPPSMSYFLAR